MFYSFFLFFFIISFCKILVKIFYYELFNGNTHNPCFKTYLNLFYIIFIATYANEVKWRNELKNAISQKFTTFCLLPSKQRIVIKTAK